MSQVRETINLLTIIFDQIGCTKIKAESFRLAKFNNDDVVIIALPTLQCNYFGHC